MESTPNNDHISDKTNEARIHTGIDKAAGYAHQIVERSAELSKDAEIPEKMSRITHFIQTRPLEAVGVSMIVGIVICLIL